MTAWMAKACAAVVALAFVAGAAHAQSDYPNKVIRIIVPVVPGGLADTLARAVAQQLSISLNQQVIVENKAGGNFQIALNHVIGSPPDGYTLLVAQEGAIVLNPHLYKNSILRPAEGSHANHRHR